jgi:hypothetical protein
MHEDRANLINPKRIKCTIKPMTTSGLKDVNTIQGSAKTILQKVNDDYQVSPGQTLEGGDVTLPRYIPDPLGNAVDPEDVALSNGNNGGPPVIIGRSSDPIGRIPIVPKRHGYALRIRSGLSTVAQELV